MSKSGPFVPLLVVLLAGAFGLAGCASTPAAPVVRQDPLANLPLSTPKTVNTAFDPTFRKVTAALLLLPGTKQSLQRAGKMAEKSGSEFDQEKWFVQVGDLFRRHFKAAMKVESLDEAKAMNADVVIVLDTVADVRYGNALFGPGTRFLIDVSAIFMTPDQKPIDTIRVEKSVNEVTTGTINNTVHLTHRDLEQAIFASDTLTKFARARSSAPRITADKTSPQASGSSRDAISSDVQSDVDKPNYKLKENPDNFALVVGIEKYSGSLPDAQFANRDAEAVRDHLVAMGYPRRNVIYLTGPQATRTGIQKYLDEWFPKNVKPESTVFVYYSGHGAPDTKTGQAYIVPWDGDPKFLETTAYPVKDLYAALNRLPAKQVVAALDACFSGAGGRSVLAQGARPMVVTADPGVFPQGKVVLFGAAQGDEITGGLDEQGHGLFTYHFLKGLIGGAKNASGAVTTKGLYEYLKPLVQDGARRDNREQTPTIHGLQQDQVLVRFE